MIEKLPKSQHRVLISYAKKRAAAKENDLAFSLRGLSKFLTMDESTVATHLSRLAKKGYVKHETEYGGYGDLTKAGKDYLKDYL